MDPITATSTNRKNNNKLYGNKLMRYKARHSFVKGNT